MVWWNPELQSFEKFHAGQGSELTGQDMWQCDCGKLRYYKELPYEAFNHEKHYHAACGRCKCDPCQCVHCEIGSSALRG